MRDNKKILLFISSLVSGGAQRQMVLLANELSRAGNEIALLVYHSNNQLAYQLDKRVEVIEIVKQHKVDLKFIYHLWRFLKQYKPQVLISYLFIPNMYARLIGRLAGVPRIITSERNVDLGHSRSRVFLERLLSRFGHAVVVNANTIKATYGKELRMFSPIIHVIYNAVDLDYFKKTEVVINDVCPDIVDEEVVILLPARVEAQKNHRCLIEAINSLPASYLRYLKVVFAGNIFDQVLYESLMKLIDDYQLTNNFKFIGPKKNMPELYSAVDIVVLPSLWEGFPNVVVEAMACESLVVASDVSDVPAIISDGKDGYIFPSDNVEILMEKLRYCLDMKKTDRDFIGSASRERVAELCSMQRFRADYLALIDANTMRGTN
ncbi:glycosyltransferase [Pseudomonadales bacterium]|nr:glycosyltransferase [Pseudomonadales bacterium]